MHLWKTFLISFCWAILSTQSYAVLPDWTRPVLDRWHKNGNLKVGLSVLNVRTGEQLLVENADVPMSPASVMKVLTSFTALSNLGPDFLFQTEIKTTGKQVGDRLVGDLYIVGSGDPLFVSERLWLFANQISRLGIRHFEGKIYWDTSLFEPLSLEDRSIDSAEERAYNAPLSPLSFNFNTTTLTVQPSFDGKQALVSADPPNSYVQLKSEIKLVPGSAISVTSHYLSSTGHSETYVLKGSIGRQAAEKKIYRSLRNPPAYFISVLAQLLKEKGIQFPSSGQAGKVPSKARTLVSFDSLPLPQIIDGLNKFSNNFVADQILLTVAAKKKGAPGTFEKGSQVIRDALANEKISSEGLQCSNGSGLARDIRVTPNQFSRVLVAAYRNLFWGPYFVSSLPTSGVDGTLKQRFQTNGYHARVKAKTGRIAGVAALAGYVQAQNGEILAVTSLLNEAGGNADQMHQLQDDLFRRLADWR